MLATFFFGTETRLMVGLAGLLGRAEVDELVEDVPVELLEVVDEELDDEEFDEDELDEVVVLVVLDPLALADELAPPLALVRPAWTLHTGHAPGPCEANTRCAMAIC